MPKDIEEVNPEKQEKALERDAKEVQKEMNKVPEGKKLVNEDALEKLIAKVDKQDIELKRMKAEGEAIADKQKLSAHRQKIAPKGKSIVRLHIWTVKNKETGKDERKIVTGWDRLTKNLCEKNHLGRWVEEQEGTIYLEDGTKIEDLPYSTRSKRMEFEDATVLKKYESGEMLDEETPQIMLDIVTEEGKELTIDKRYVN